jgi:hypothetical protein
MTQLDLIEQAKQGDPSAIAALMNKSLQPKGMTALVDRHDDRLEVTLAAERVPNRQALTAFVEKGISNLGIQIIKSVRVMGQQIGAESPAWTHELHLQTPTPEFEPEFESEFEPEGTAEAGVPAWKADRVEDFEQNLDQDFSFEQDLDHDLEQDFNMDAIVEVEQNEQRLTELSQLQDLLSEEPEQPVSERQRQLLEEQIESIWQEQSAQSDNFLLDLMAGTPEEPYVQSEEFLDAPPNVQFQSEGQPEGLWLEQPDVEQNWDEASSEGFLSDLASVSSESTASEADLADLSDLSNSSEDFAFLTEQDQPSSGVDEDFSDLFVGSAESTETFETETFEVDPLLHSSQDWLDASEDETDEPDEILTGFMDDQPRSPMLDFDQVAEEEEDQPDEILLDFLPSSSEQPNEPSLTSTETSTDQSEFGSGFESGLEPNLELDDLAGLPSEEELVNFFEESSEPIEEPESETLQAQEPIEFLGDLSEEFHAESYSMVEPSADADQDLGFLDDSQAAIDSTETFQSGLDEFSTSDEFGAVNTFEADDFTPVNEFGSDEFRNESSELSFDDVSLTFNESLSDESGKLTDSPAESWDQPPIEFLQGEPDLTLPEMPTEQLDEPMPAFTMEPIDSSSPSGAQQGDFPQGFLLDSQESLEDLSEEFYVDPNENPFVEQMEENRDRPDELSSDTPNSPDEEFGAFDQTDWQLPNAGANNAAPDNSTDLSDLSAELSELYLEPEVTYTSTSPDEFDSNNFSLDTPSSEELSEEELINFFETDPPAAADPIGSSEAISNLSEADLQPSDQYGQYREYGLSDEYGLDEPFTTSSSSIPTQPPAFPTDTEFSDSQFPESEFSDAELSDSAFPPTEIPEPLPATQIPVREELSQEALDEQVAAYDFEQHPTVEGDRTDGTVIIPPDADVERSTDSRGSPWLFPLIFLGISGWIVGLISFAFLWSRLSSPPAQVQDDPAQAGDVVGAVPTADSCTPPAEGGAPVALSNLQFQPNTENPQQVNLVGCVTNRTQQAIDIVSVAYRSGGGGGTVGGLNIPDNLIQPGQTVVFTSRFTVPSEVSNMAIDTVFWQPAGTTASEEAGTSIQVNR